MRIRERSRCGAAGRPGIHVFSTCGCLALKACFGLRPVRVRYSNLFATATELRLGGQPPSPGFTLVCVLILVLVSPHIRSLRSWTVQKTPSFKMRSTMTTSTFFFNCCLVAGATATMPYVGTSEDGSSLVVNSSLTGDVFINGMPVRGLVTVSSGKTSVLGCFHMHHQSRKRKALR